MSDHEGWIAAEREEMLAREPHCYTVEVILVGAEPYPCVFCGEGRRAPAHEAWQAARYPPAGVSSTGGEER